MPPLLSRIFTSLSAKRGDAEQEQLKSAQINRLQFCLMEHVVSGHFMSARTVIQQVGSLVNEGKLNRADATEVFTGGNYTVARQSNQNALSTILHSTATRLDGFDRRTLFQDMLEAGLSLFDVRKIEQHSPLMAKKKAVDTVLHDMARSYPLKEKTHIPNGLYCRLSQDEFEPFEIALLHLFKQHGSLNTMHDLKGHKIVTGPARNFMMPRPTQSVLDSLSEKGTERLQGFLKHRGIMLNLSSPDFSMEPVKGQRKTLWQRTGLG